MSRAGRPRMFDRDEAIFNAMLLFWDEGFEATSLSQLRKVMGNISASSFYTTFQSKEDLFCEVVNMYMNTFGQVSLCLKDISLEPREAVEQALRQTAKMQTDSSHPHGCLVVLSATNCSPKNAHIQDMLKKQRAQIRDWLTACIKTAVKKGELPKTLDVDILTTVIYSFMNGISIQARDGISFDTIDAAITQIMSIWDMLAQSVHTDK
ncbi:TetR/AcrR family transcriptional regulator [Clostridium lacusfryxellense]|uniref:TetR/AcrR family transcriptional regulator n=1 Tax=Clostridium lacusfryxellense TaxID=205328 RepID=UPI001C0A9BF8|nr:TetR/AcrR family transcriptional regulator [Clostridium lacusfryxellense]MBU3114427.1 TetR/AcrR family transcriptional regulator [Clostridium lacusfryxellense]